jgi:hypothetical protein
MRAGTIHWSWSLSTVLSYEFGDDTATHTTPYLIGERFNNCRVVQEPTSLIQLLVR